MNSMTGSAERIDLLATDDPRDVVHRAVACLAQGGVVGLPTETTYSLVASAHNASAVARLNSVKNAAHSRPLSLGIRTPDELIDWIPDASQVGRKLVRRAWPGPVTFLFQGDIHRGLASSLPAEVRQIVASDHTLGLRLPGHDVIREILELLPGPLVLTSAPSEKRTATADCLAAINGLDMILDDGPTVLEGKNTVVRVQDDRWSIVREGVIDAASLQRMTGTILLFVCTGNTCRSPMAEAICRVLIAERLQCDVDEVESRGYVVGSAGLAAGNGMRAAGDAIAIVQSRGGSLRNHSSRQISPTMIAQADLILAMTRDHREALLDEFPEADARVALLNPQGGDIADPIGTDRETYRRTAEAIESHLRHWLNELGL